jgi:hypothetical protein
MKLALTLLAFGLSVLHGHTQLSLGIKTGYVKAWEHYGDIGLPDDAKIHINGFQVSGIIDLPISPIVSLRMEPGYIRRGAACYPGYVSSIRDTRFRFNYVELPVMLAIHHRFGSSRFGVTGKAGYGASYIVRGTQESVFLLIDESSSIKVNFKDEDWINRWDHGLYAGIGASYFLGANQLTAEIMHYHGLSDVDENNTTKNRTLQYSLGYLVSF